MSTHRMVGREWNGEERRAGERRSRLHLATEADRRGHSISARTLGNAMRYVISAHRRKRMIHAAMEQQAAAAELVRLCDEAMHAGHTLRLQAKITAGLLEKLEAEDQ